MADQIIDSLIVTLGLDASDFNGAQKQAAQHMLDLQSTVRDSTDAMGASFLRFAGSFSAFFLGFEGLKGAIDLVKETVEQFKQLDISAEMLGTHVRDLRTWGEVGQMAGGSTQDAANFLQQIQSARMGMRFGRAPSESMVMGLGQLGLSSLIFGQGAMPDMTSIFHSIEQAAAKAFPGNSRQAISNRGQYLMAAGIPQSLAFAAADPAKGDAMLKQATATNKGVTDKVGDAALATANKFLDLKYKVEDLATLAFPALNSAVDFLEAAFVDLTKMFNDFMNSSFGQWIKKEFTPMDPKTAAFVQAGIDRARVHPLDAIHNAGAAAEKAAHWAQNLLHGAVPNTSQHHAAAANTTGSLIGPGGQGGSQHNFNVGSINVNTQASDAQGIAASIQAAMQRKFNVAQADSGVLA